MFSLEYCFYKEGSTIKRVVILLATSTIVAFGNTSNAAVSLDASPTRQFIGDAFSSQGQSDFANSFLADAFTSELTTMVIQDIRSNFLSQDMSLAGPANTMSPEISTSLILHGEDLRVVPGSILEAGLAEAASLDFFLLSRSAINQRTRREQEKCWKTHYRPLHYYSFPESPASFRCAVKKRIPVTGRDFTIYLSTHPLALRTTIAHHG